MKLIGSWFGIKLTTFIERLSTDESQRQGIPGSSRRALQTLLQTKTKNSKSKLSRSKMEIYSINIEYKGMVLYKTIAYMISWVVKIVSAFMHHSLKAYSAQTFKKWKIYIIVYVRKIHFSVMGAAAMHVVFFGTRILLHRKTKNLGDLLSKAVAVITISLLIFDLMEILAAGFSLEQPKKVEEEGEEEKVVVNQKIKEKEKKRIPAVKGKQIGGILDNQILKNRGEAVLNEKWKKGFTSRPRRSDFRQSMMERRLTKNSMGSRKMSSNSVEFNLLQKGSRASTKIEKIDEKKVVDVPKTLLRNRRNETLDLFLSSILKNEKVVFHSKICCLSNWFTLVHLAAYHLLIPALPLLPQLLLPVLIIMEIGFFLVSLIPYLAITRFVGWFYFTAKVLRFILLEEFLICCLILCLESKNRRKPLNTKIQELAVLAIIFGLAIDYIVFIVNMIMVIMQAVKGVLNKKKKKIGYIIFKEKKNELGGFSTKDRTSRAL